MYKHVMQQHLEVNDSALVRVGYMYEESQTMWHGLWHLPLCKGLWAGVLWAW